MQQEMFDCRLLNYLSIYSLLKFLELPKDQRIFDDKIHPQSTKEEIEDEDATIVCKKFDLNLKI